MPNDALDDLCRELHAATWNGSTAFGMCEAPVGLLLRAASELARLRRLFEKIREVRDDDDRLVEDLGPLVEEAIGDDDGY